MLWHVKESYRYYRGLVHKDVNFLRDWSMKHEYHKESEDCLMHQNTIFQQGWCMPFHDSKAVWEEGYPSVEDSPVNHHAWCISHRARAKAIAIRQVALESPDQQSMKLCSLLPLQRLYPMLRSCYCTISFAQVHPLRGVFVLPWWQIRHKTICLYCFFIGSITTKEPQNCDSTAFFCKDEA